MTDRLLAPDPPVRENSDTSKQASPIGGGGGVLPPLPPSLEPQTPPPPLAASEASRHFFSGFFRVFFAFNHD